MATVEAVLERWSDERAASRITKALLRKVTRNVLSIFLSRQVFDPLNSTPSSHRVSGLAPRSGCHGTCDPFLQSLSGSL